MIPKAVNNSKVISRILVVGAGQLGSRHLQGLAKINLPIEITVIDPSEESLKVSRQRFEEVAGFMGSIIYSTKLPSEALFDIAIISTNSNVRKGVIENVVLNNKVKYFILEKFLFQKRDDYFDIEKLLISNNIRAWVNCSRRMFPFYQEIKDSLDNQKHIHFSVSCSNLFLGSNAIHYLDLFAFLSNDYNFEIETNFDQEILKSKRNGFIDFSGHIYGRSDIMSFDIHSYSVEGTSNMLIIESPNQRYIVEENFPVQLSISKKENNWQWEKKEINIPYQSGLTNIVCEELLAKGNCDLSTYSDSTQLHLMLLEKFIAHYNKINKTNSDICPIT